MIITPTTCPACQSVWCTLMYSSATAVHCPPFTDEHGKLHVHDPNEVEQHMRCARCGHEWTEKSQRKCWCGWPEVTNGRAA